MMREDSSALEQTARGGVAVESFIHLVGVVEGGAGGQGTADLRQRHGEDTRLRRNQHRG